MTAKTFFTRFGILVAVSVAGGPLYALILNMLVYFGAIPEELMDQSYGTSLTRQAVMIWMGAVTAGFASIFIKDDLRYILLLSPLYAPSVYAIAHTLMQ